MTLRPSRTEAAAAALAALELAGALAVALRGPARIPLHYGIDGAADRWGSSTEAAAWLAALAALGLGAVAALGLAARRVSADAPRRRGLSLAQALVAGAIAAVALLQVGVAVLAQPGRGPGALPAATVSLVLLGLGLALGRVPPNALVGVRTPWSLSSRLAWDKSNRLAGRLFAAAGACGLLAAALLPTPAAMGLLTVAALGAAGAATVESWRVWRRDPERRTV